MKNIIKYLEVRIRNYGFWISIFSLIPLVLQAFGISLIPNYDFIVNLILMILVVLGITNNPTTENKWFGDDQEEHKILDQIEETLTEEVNSTQQK